MKYEVILVNATNHWTILITEQWTYSARVCLTQVHITHLFYVMNIINRFKRLSKEKTEVDCSQSCGNAMSPLAKCHTDFEAAVESV